jgi:DNA polymerase/3'-5' exonuclease PolX
MKLEYALPIAEYIKSLLEPNCLPGKCVIAGSIRRKKPEIGDIEIVCIANPFQTGMFEDGIATVINKWPKVKGEIDIDCKYTQRVIECEKLPQHLWTPTVEEKINVDIFFAVPENWGNILLIRTGSWKFSKLFMGTWLPQNGYKADGGFVYTTDGKPMVCYTEDVLFGMIGKEFIKPEDRNYE